MKQHLYMKGIVCVVATGLLAGCGSTQPIVNQPVTAVAAPAPIQDVPSVTPVLVSTPPSVPEPPSLHWHLNNRSGPVVSDDPAAKGKKTVVLTFDDGPDPVTTPKVLDALKAQNVKALFFVMAPAKQHPELLQRMVAEGHLVGIHTMNHPNMTELNKQQQRDEITTISDVVTKATGKKPYFFRPPYGAYDDNTIAVAEEQGVRILNWSHGSGDWMDVKDGHKDLDVLVQDVLAETPRNSQMTPLHPGAVILFHDTLRHTAEALPVIIKGLRDKGYDFVLPERS